MQMKKLVLMLMKEAFGFPAAHQIIAGSNEVDSDCTFWVEYIKYLSAFKHSLLRSVKINRKNAFRLPSASFTGDNVQTFGIPVLLYQPSPHAMQLINFLRSSVVQNDQLHCVQVGWQMQRRKIEVRDTTVLEVTQQPNIAMKITLT